MLVILHLLEGLDRDRGPFRACPIPRGRAKRSTKSQSARLHPEQSHLPLRKWFAAIYLMCESKKGMSANQLHRTLGVSYKTAWYLCHRIREAMGNDPFVGPTLFGIVEVDETLVGGKRRNVGSGSKEGKTWVAGAIQRDSGQVRVERIPNIRRGTLHDFIHRTVKDEAEAIYTDELKSPTWGLKITTPYTGL